jgi:glycosyltransferase involved in cell wall biosynthesis
MNILFLDQFSDPGGGQGALLDVLPVIAERGWSACVGMPGNGPIAESARANGASVEDIPCPNLSSGRKSLPDLVRYAWTFRRLVRRIQQAACMHRADLIYVNGPRVLPAAAWAFRNRRPVLFHCHARLAHHYDAMLAAWAIRHSKATVIACCRFAAEPLIRYLQPELLAIVPYGVRACAPARLPGAAGVWRMGVIGRISPEKGQVEFIRAAQILSREIPGCRFVVCGAPLFSDPEANRYHAAVRQLALGLPVEFIGWQDNVPQVLSELDLLVVPSIREPGAPRVIPEAYAASVPVVAFPSGGIPEIVRDGETGFLVEPRTHEALALKIRQLIVDSPQRLRAAAHAGHAAWEREHTLARYQERIATIIQCAAKRAI